MLKEDCFNHSGIRSYIDTIREASDQNTVVVRSSLSFDTRACEGTRDTEERSVISRRRKGSTKENRAIGALTFVQPTSFSNYKSEPRDGIFYLLHKKLLRNENCNILWRLISAMRSAFSTFALFSVFFCSRSVYGDDY